MFHRSDPPKQTELPAGTPSASQKSILTVVVPPLGSILGRHPPSSRHTSQEVDELLDSPAPPKRRRTKPQPRLPSSSPPKTPPRLPSPPPRPASPQFPTVAGYFEYLILNTTEPIPPPVLGRAGHPHSIFPELVVPASIVDLTPEFAHRRGSYWRVDAEMIPWTRDGYLQVQASINAWMALICVQEKESRALLVATQQNLISALQLQCANAEDLELIRLENRLLKRMFDQLVPYSPASPPA